MEDLNHHHEYDETSANAVSNNHGWQKVTYAKRRKNQPQNKQKPAAISAADDTTDKNGNVFRAIEQKSEDRHRRIVQSQRKLVTVVGDTRKARSKRDDSDSESEEERENLSIQEKDDEEEKKKKKKKAEKKPKVTVAEAAGKIDAADLATFLSDISGSYGSQEHIQLMRFADYFGRAFSGVCSAQFPWVKTFRESSVAKLAEIPTSHISDAVYKTSVDWVNQRSVAALSSFVLLLLDSILADLSNQLTTAKNAKKASQQSASKSQVAVFVVLSLVLRRKPDVLVSLLPILREHSKYQGQDKLPVIIWMIYQACQGDLAVGLFAWTHNLLPMLNNKSTNNPLSRDLILQLVERILVAPKAHSILVSGAVRKGERLIPPAELEILLRVTFPVSSARVKATERFEAVYPILKEVALAGAPGSKAMKQVSQQIFRFAIVAAGEGKPELAEEATNILLWCLAQNIDIYKHWDKVYLDNLEASVAVLKELSGEWREHVNQSSLEPLKQTIQSFQQKNDKAWAEESSAGSAQAALLKDADKYCKVILGRLSHRHGCLKAMAFFAVALAVGAAVISPNCSYHSVILGSLKSLNL